jgi:hypothetical protein
MKEWLTTIKTIVVLIIAVGGVAWGAIQFFTNRNIQHNTTELLLTQHNDLLSKHDTKLDKHEERLDSVEKMQGQLAISQQRIESGQIKVENKVDKQTDQITELIKQQADLNGIE